MGSQTSIGSARFAGFELDLRTGELRKNGRRVRLQAQPLKALRVLLEHPGELVTREQLRREVWPQDTFVDFDHGLNKAVAKLRDAVDESDTSPSIIETLPRLGYRFVPPVEWVATEPGPSIFAPHRETSEPESSNNDAVVEQQPQTQAKGSRWWRVVGVVAALACALAVGVAVRLKYGERARKPGDPIRSLAVLPLKNLSGYPNQEYLADGMTEELIGRLSGIRNLKVISRTSAMQFKDTKLSAPEIANALHVDALVEGSVMREGSRVRVHAQLIRGATDEHFWSEEYDRQLQDVLALQSDIAQAIAEKVEVTLTGQERAQLVSARPVSPEVYESYLKGMQLVDGNSKAEIEESITYFEGAAKKDPTFAPAYLGLANAYDNLSTIFVGGAPDQARPKVISAARKALELDPDLAEAHLLLADTLQKEWHWAEAEAEYRRALELSPNDARAHAAFGSWLMCQGDIEDALSWAQRGRELDPLVVNGVKIGWILFMGRRYDEAIRELRSVLAVHPESVDALSTLGFVLIADGRSQEAIPILEKRVFLMDRSPGAVELLATANARAGRRTEALRLVEELKLRRQNGYVPPGAFINPYLALGDYDEAFVWFERAYLEQSNILQFLKVHPFFDPVRNDPRFVDLLHRVGLDKSY